MAKAFKRKDHFYHKAKKEGYASRSAYKIMELDQRFSIFKKGNTVVDLGSAPGGWFKVGQERLSKNGKIIGIDLLPLQTAVTKKAVFKQGDFNDATNQEWILAQCPKKIDWVISDMSPNITGIKFTDAMASQELCREALHFSLKVLKEKGSFLCKVFPGAELENLRKEIKDHFKKVVTIVPEATRGSSKEIYIVALQFIK